MKVGRVSESNWFRVQLEKMIGKNCWDEEWGGVGVSWRPSPFRDFVEERAIQGKSNGVYFEGTIEKRKTSYFL